MPLQTDASQNGDAAGTLLVNLIVGGIAALFAAALAVALIAVIIRRKKTGGAN
jgi:hypothetical protein